MSPTLGDPAPTQKERMKLAYGSFEEIAVAIDSTPAKIPPPPDLSSSYVCQKHGEVTREKTFQICIPGTDTGKPYCLLCCVELLDKEIGKINAKSTKNISTTYKEKITARSPESGTTRPEPTK